MGTVTRGTLEAELKAKLEESGFDYWTEARVDEALDRAQRKVAFDTGCLERTFYCNVTASTREYAFPAEYLWLKSVRWDGGPIETVEPEWLDVKDPDWRDTEGDDVEYATVENGNLALCPTPASTSTGNELKIKIAIKPTAFSDDNSTIDVPDFLEEAIVNWAAYRLWSEYDEKRGRGFKRDYHEDIRPYKAKTHYPAGPNALRTSMVRDQNTYRNNY